MNPLHTVGLSLFGIMVVVLFFYGRLTVQNTSGALQQVESAQHNVNEEKKQDKEGQEIHPKRKNGPFSLIRDRQTTPSGEQEHFGGKPLKISKTSTLVDFDQFFDEFALTKQGDLVAIIELLPSTISTIIGPQAFGLNFARVIHAFEPDTTIQFVQMPIPNQVTEILDRYATKAFGWGAKAHQAKVLDKSEEVYRFSQLRFVSRLTGLHMIDQCALSSRRASFAVITQNATNLGVLTENSAFQARKQLIAKVQQIQMLFSANGIQTSLLSEDQMMDVLWYAYNPEAGAVSTSNQMAHRFLEMADRGKTERGEFRAISEKQYHRARTVEHAAAEILSPQFLEPKETHIAFHGRRMIFYFVYDYDHSIPTINRLLGPGSQYGNRLWVTYYVTAPAVEKIVAATKKVSTGKQAWQELRQRAGVLHSYQQDREIQSIEAAREGSETQENIPRMIGLYLGLMVNDDDEDMERERTEFQAILDANGLGYTCVRFSTLQAWQTILPLGQRHLKYKHITDRNIFSKDMIPLNPITSKSLIEPGGRFSGYTMLSPGNLSPVSITRKRGNGRSPSDAFIGLPGTGKSYAMKFFMTQWQAMGDRVVVIEPKPEFKESIKLLGGETIDLMKRGGFNIFSFEPIPAGRTDLAESYSQIVFDDNIAALRTLYSSIKEAPITGIENRFLIKALQESMREIGMDSHDPETWGQGEVFLRDLYHQLAHNLRDEDPETVRFMLNVLEQYAVPDGQYYKRYNTPTALDLGGDLILLSFGITQFSQDQTMKALSYHYALRIATQYAIKSLLFGERSVPMHIIIDEASQMMINGSIVSSVVKMLSLMDSYSVAIHLAFQDMKAICRADQFMLEENVQSTNSLQGVISAYYFFKQSIPSAELAGRMMNLTQDEIIGLTSLAVGQCVLALAGEPNRIPLIILVHPELHGLFDTRPEAQKTRLESEYG